MFEDLSINKDRSTLLARYLVAPEANEAKATQEKVLTKFMLTIGKYKLVFDGDDDMFESEYGLSEHLYLSRCYNNIDVPKLMVEFQTQDVKNKGKLDLSKMRRCVEKHCSIKQLTDFLLY